ncbi:hypothetical protein ACFVOO_16170 [Streptomyces rochei]|uniref:hypothetical protein n=1 Tax=Streptomyces rochei TaxID=1928 RepID=UPI00368C2EAD
MSETTPVTDDASATAAELIARAAADRAAAQAAAAAKAAEGGTGIRDGILPGGAH